MKLLYKYFLMTAVPVLLSLVIIGAGLSSQMYHYSVSEKHNSLERVANYLSELTLDLYDNHTLYREQFVRSILPTMTDGGRMHVVICDENGQIFLSSDKYGNTYIGKYIPKDILQKSVFSGEYTSTGTLNGLYKGMNYTVGLPVKSGSSQPIAYVFVTTSVDNVRMLMTYVIRLFLYLSIASFLIIAAFCYFIVRRLTRPLKEVATASRDFARGNFKTRVAVCSSDEIGELTSAFNSMADSLEKSEELRRTFVANVSHELRSPMTSIGGFVDGILDGTIPPERQNHYLEIISAEVRRLSRLVSRMLDITVLQGTDITAQSVEFDFCELLRRAVISLETRIDEKSLALNIQLPERCVTVHANEDSIFQVIYNLIDNAIKFADDGSVIDINVIERSDRITFSVKNSGAEIPKEQLPYVFDRFHKADDSRSKDKAGLGLGLYIAKSIVNQHKGSIIASSDNGATVFSFTIPMRQRGQNS